MGTILDNDALPTVSISDAGGFELGNGGYGHHDVHVTLSNPSAVPIFVDYSTANGTATAGVDFRTRQGTLTFAPGETDKTIVVEILPDTKFTTSGVG